VRGGRGADVTVRRAQPSTSPPTCTRRAGRSLVSVVSVVSLLLLLLLAASLPLHRSLRQKHQQQTGSQ